MQWIEKWVNQEAGIAVGDVSISEEDNRGLDELYEGPKASDIKLALSESQRLQAAQIKPGNRSNGRSKKYGIYHPRQNIDFQLV